MVQLHHSRRLGRFAVTASAIAVLLSSCIDVSGYHLRDHPELPDASGGASDRHGIGGSRAAKTTSTVAESGGTTAATSGGASSSGGSLHQETTTRGGSSARQSTKASGECKAATMLICADMKTLDACASLPGCTYSEKGTCYTVKNLSCADLSDSVAGCLALPGCTSTGQGSCKVDFDNCVQDPFYGGCAGGTDCSIISTRYSCEEVNSCLWATAPGSCSGTPRSCDSFVTNETCKTSYNCTWKAGDCVGTPIPCPQFSTREACETSENCLWSVSL